MLHLERNQVPAFLRSGYNGNQFRAKATEQVSIPIDAGLWSGGSRSMFHAVELATGRQVPLPDQGLAPWDKERKERVIPLRPGFAIVQSIMFQGKDLGLTFHIHPADIAKMITQDDKPELDPKALKFLAIVRGVKSSYRADEYRRQGFTQAEIDAFKDKFISMGYLDKRGAITIPGKNACANMRPY